MKKPSLSTVRTLFFSLLAAGIVLCFTGSMLKAQLMMLLGMLCVPGALVIYVVLYRCPHCGKFLGRDVYESCPKCKKRLK